MSCCQFAEDDEIETDPDVFDCVACPVAQAAQDLWPENAEAWDLFQRLATIYDLVMPPKTEQT